MEKITELTPEQEAQLEVYFKKWSDIGLSTEPGNRDKAEQLIKELYKLEGFKVPPIYWFNSPFEAAEQIKKDGEASPQLSACFGQHSAGWLAFYDYIFNVLKVSEDKAMMLHIELSKCCGWFFTYEEAVYLCDKTSAANVDEEGNLHCLTGPALAFRDGNKVYSVRGVQVPEHVIEAPETITVDEILNESNIEVRRVMMDQMGHERFMEQAKAEVLDSDTDELGHPRRLLKVDIEGDEAMVVCQVVNSTPEPDGSDKMYQLRVPPTITTCKEAVAWTFGIDPKDYVLKEQS